MSRTITLIVIGTIALIAVAALLGCGYLFFQFQALEKQVHINKQVQLRASDVQKLLSRAPPPPPVEQPEEAPKPSVIEKSIGSFLSETINTAKDDAQSDTSSVQELPVRTRRRKAAVVRTKTEAPTEATVKEEEE